MRRFAATLAVVALAISVGFGPMASAAGADSAVWQGWTGLWLSWGMKREAQLAAAHHLPPAPGTPGNAGWSDPRGTAACPTLKDAWVVAPDIAYYPSVAQMLQQCNVAQQLSSPQAPSCAALLAAIGIDPWLSGDSELKSGGCQRDALPTAAPTSTSTHAANPSFSDLGGYGWAQKAITVLAAQGIFVGTRPGRFDPAGTVTRGQWAVLATRLFQLPPASAPLFFSDVAPTDWYFGGVETAGGYVPGSAAGVFHPGDSATRLGVAATVGEVLASVGGVPVPEGTALQKIWGAFSDTQGLSGNEAAYAAIPVAMHVMTGYPDGTFGPQGSITRAEMAVVLDRLLTDLTSGCAQGGTATGQGTC